jgi:hypothetical protein
METINAKLGPNAVAPLGNPDDYTKEIYVFGTDEGGMHYGGWSPHLKQQNYATKYYGAQLGVPEGRQGNAYAIPLYTTSVENHGNGAPVPIIQFVNSMKNLSQVIANEQAANVKQIYNLSEITCPPQYDFDNFVDAFRPFKDNPNVKLPPEVIAAFNRIEKDPDAGLSIDKRIAKLSREHVRYEPVKIKR